MKMDVWIIEVPKNLWRAFVLSWILVLTGLKAHRVDDQLIVTTGVC